MVYVRPLLSRLHYLKISALHVVSTNPKNKKILYTAISKIKGINMSKKWNGTPKSSLESKVADEEMLSESTGDYANFSSYPSDMANKAHESELKDSRERQASINKNRAERQANKAKVATDKKKSEAVAARKAKGLEDGVKGLKKSIRKKHEGYDYGADAMDASEAEVTAYTEKNIKSEQDKRAGRQKSINQARHDRQVKAKVAREKQLAKEKSQPKDIKDVMSDGEKKAKLKGLN